MLYRACRRYSIGVSSQDWPLSVTPRFLGKTNGALKGDALWLQRWKVQMRRGTLFLVAGPSGAGKDTLLDAARLHLESDPRFVFPRRLITRPPDAGGEDHVAISAQDFARLRSAGKLLLHWNAHGLSYGIPGTAGDALAAGHHVVANVSRSVLADARQRLQPVRILSVEVPVRVLRQRLQERRRESAEDVEDRLERATAFAITGDDVDVIRNDGSVETAVDRFLDALGR